MMPPAGSESRQRLLDAALRVIRAKGYAASTVDDICAEAELTKGSFFHHFKGKEDFALAAIEHWNLGTGEVFANASYQAVADPRDRLLAYLAFRASLLDRDIAQFSCLLGTMVQEVYLTHPAIGRACGQGIASHADTVAAIVAQAKARYAPQADWSAQSLALHTQACLQGAFVLAKSQGSTQVARDCVEHLRRYVISLLGEPGSPGPEPVRAPAHPPPGRPN